MKFNLGRKIKVDIVGGKRGSYISESHLGILKGVFKHHIVIEYPEHGYRESFNKGDIIAYTAVGKNYKFYQKLNGKWEQITVTKHLGDLREYLK